MTLTIVQRTNCTWLVLTDNGGTRLIPPTTFAKALAFAIEYYSNYVILTLAQSNETARRIPESPTKG